MLLSIVASALCAEWFGSLWMRRPFCILNVLGDVLDDGELQFIEAAKTLKAATRRIRALEGSCPGEYVIYNQQTGESLSVEAGAEAVVASWLRQVGRDFLKQCRAKAKKGSPKEPPWPLMNPR